MLPELQTAAQFLPQPDCHAWKQQKEAACCSAKQNVKYIVPMKQRIKQGEAGGYGKNCKNIRSGHNAILPVPTRAQKSHRVLQRSFNGRLQF